MHILNCKLLTTLVILLLFFNLSAQDATEESPKLFKYHTTLSFGVNFLSPYEFSSQVVSPGSIGKSYFYPGIFIQASVGKTLSKNMDVQLEIEHQSNNSKESILAGNTIDKYGNWNSTSLLTNISFHPLEFNGFSPFVGIGAGISHISARETAYQSSVFIRDKSYHFIWQIAAGISKKVAENFSLNLLYDFESIDVEHSNTNSNQVRQYHNQAICIGISYYFGE